jgi:uncharacterized protein (TIGR03067 family)
MTRFALLGLLAALPLAAADDKKDDGTQKERARFQGEWKVASATFAASPAPKEALDATVHFDGDKLTVKERGDNAEAGSYRIDPKASPAAHRPDGPKGEQVRASTRSTRTAS